MLKNKDKQDIDWLTCRSSANEGWTYTYNPLYKPRIMETLGDFQQKMKADLRAAGIETAALDARLLIQEQLGMDQADLIAHPERPLSEDDRHKINGMVQRRMMGEPVSKILGRKEFWGLEFKVTEDTLDPRPDTEILIQQALQWARAQRKPLKILDLGTGSGCILITLLHELPDSQGVAVDLSEKALDIAKYNAERHAVQGRCSFVQSNWLDNINESFDLVVSNPPYIPESSIESLPKEVQNHDPILALEGGKDGLDPYRKIFSSLKSVLKLEGAAFFEFGLKQGPNLKRLVGESNLSIVGITPDIAGIPRVVEISNGEN